MKGNGKRTGCTSARDRRPGSVYRQTCGKAGRAAFPVRTVPDGPGGVFWLELRSRRGAGHAHVADTHASFLGPGLKRLLPGLCGPWMHTPTQLPIGALALVLRLWNGRTDLKKRAEAIPPEGFPS